MRKAPLISQSKSISMFKSLACLVLEKSASTVIRARTSAGLWWSDLLPTGCVAQGKDEG